MSSLKTSPTSLSRRLIVRSRPRIYDSIFSSFCSKLKDFSFNESQILFIHQKNYLFVECIKRLNSEVQAYIKSVERLLSFTEKYEFRNQVFNVPVATLYTPPTSNVIGTTVGSFLIFVELN